MFDTKCRFGHPWYGVYHSEERGDVVPRGAFIAELWTMGERLSERSQLDPIIRRWPAGEKHAIGSAVFRIRHDAAEGRTEVAGADVEWQPVPGIVVPIRSQCAGYPSQIDIEAPRSDIPALSVRAGAVVITAAGRPFVRADSNGNGKVDLSDAVWTLQSLFQGQGRLDCEDAADANDDGRVDISDAVHTLAHLFLGGLAPPPPFPEEGHDPTGDALGCGAPG